MENSGWMVKIRHMIWATVNPWQQDSSGLFLHGWWGGGEEWAGSGRRPPVPNWEGCAPGLSRVPIDARRTVSFGKVPNSDRALHFDGPAYLHILSGTASELSSVPFYIKKGTPPTPRRAYHGRTSEEMAGPFRERGRSGSASAACAPLYPSVLLIRGTLRNCTQSKTSFKGGKHSEQAMSSDELPPSFSACCCSAKQNSRQKPIALSHAPCPGGAGGGTAGGGAVPSAPPRTGCGE